MAASESRLVSADAQSAAIDALVAALGSGEVAVAGEQLEFFRDPYTLDPSVCCAAVFPESVEQVQDVVRIANQTGVPLWTTSQGRNNGYGGATARVAGSIAVSLRRMNRIIEVDDDLAYAIVEPGVRFHDLYQHLRAHGSSLMMSTPDLGWGSIVGNTLDHGIGYTVYGDHAAAQCGMEVVLADGQILRTGLGAKSGSPAWPTHPRGYGPTADGLFMQSNFGIVTKMGVWLMPRPEVFKSCTVMLERRADLKRFVDVMRPLAIDRTVNGLASVGNPIAAAAAIGPRTQWYDGPGAMPPEAVEEMRLSLGLPYWGGRIPIYGRRAIVELQYTAVQDAIAQIPDAKLVATDYGAEELQSETVPWFDQAAAGIPNDELLRILGWRSRDSGGHIGFAPITPARGADAMVAVDIAESTGREHGLDTLSGIGLYGRSILAIAVLLFDAGDPDQVERATRGCEEMIRLVGAAGYGEYRSHTQFMDLAAAQYDFNDCAQLRFSERIKDALDPNGILSPGKQGIWPRALREHSAAGGRL